MQNLDNTVIFKEKEDRSGEGTCIIENVSALVYLICSFPSYFVIRWFRRFFHFFFHILPFWIWFFLFHFFNLSYCSLHSNVCISVCHLGVPYVHSPFTCAINLFLSKSHVDAGFIYFSNRIHTKFYELIHPLYMNATCCRWAFSFIKQKTDKRTYM